MVKGKLAKWLAPAEDGSAVFRWQAVVPLGTNPFLLLETIQLALVGAAIVIVTLSLGIYLTDGMLTPADAVVVIKIGAMVVGAVCAAFLLVSLLFFRNRYFALYQCDLSGIYYETTRGKDEGSGLFLSLAGRPVCGVVTSFRTKGRYLPWDKVDRYHDIPSLRVILLRRGFWHMLRMYTPDDATHQKVLSVLAAKNLLYV